MTTSARVSDGSVSLALGGAAVFSATPGQPVRNKVLSIEAAWSGTSPVGVFKLQTSFDGGANWRDVPRAADEFISNGNLQPAGGASAATWIFVNVPGGLWRIGYTGTSGSGASALRWTWHA